MKTKFNSFGRNGVFTCECCKRKTRETSHDHADLKLCAECYDMGGIENQGSDEGWTDALKAEWSNLNADLVRKGGESQTQPWEG